MKWTYDNHFSYRISFLVLLETNFFEVKEFKNIQIIYTILFADFGKKGENIFKGGCYLSLFQLGRYNFYHRNSISRDKAYLVRTESTKLFSTLWLE